MRYFAATARPVVEDLAGTLAFYLLYVATGSAAVAAGTGLAIGLAQIGWHIRRGGPMPMLLLLGVALTVVLAAISLATDDPRVLLAKPSVAYAVVGAIMLPRGWVIRYVPAVARDLLPARTFDRVGWAWAALMFATAALNLVLVGALPPRVAAAAFVAWGVASKLSLFLAQYVVLRARAVRAYRARADATG